MKIKYNWKKIKNKYKSHFNANSGRGPVSSATWVWGNGISTSAQYSTDTNGITTMGTNSVPFNHHGDNDGFHSYYGNYNIFIY